MSDKQMTKEKSSGHCSRAAGIDAAARRRWHAEFEAREPQAHQAFLESASASPASRSPTSARTRQ